MAVRQAPGMGPWIAALCLAVLAGCGQDTDVAITAPPVDHDAAVPGADLSSLDTPAPADAPDIPNPPADVPNPPADVPNPPADVPNPPADVLGPDVPADADDAAADTADAADAPDAVICPGAAGCPCKAHADCTSGHCGKDAAGQAVCSETCPEASVCDDGDACTGPDGCKGGQCNGAPLDCDDKNVCTTDSCDPKAGCQHAPATAACDDGSACTASDACKDGGCSGQAVDCDDGNPCTDDSCAPKLGCQHSPNVASCSDSNPCTLGDACDGGACTGGKVKNCDDQNPCTQDACAPESGACVHLPAEVTCDDGNLCTSGDTCATGQCGGKPVSCDDGNACTTDSCDAKTGCGYLDNQGKCDDGNACTDGDKCSGGKCKGTAKDVTECDDANVCTADVCDPATGCVHKNTDGACSDGNACTVGDTCTGGKCEPGTNAGCDCQKDSDCAGKEDGNLCNGTLYCDKSGALTVCKVKPGSVVTCATDGDGPCAQNKCDTVTGKCAMAPAADGKPCDADGSSCTVDDACAAGKCAAGKALTCDDQNACTTDSCDPTTGCKYVATTAPCDADGNACTVGDACQDKVCLAGKLKPCDDGNACTQDSCDAKTGACVFDGKPLDGDPCDADGSACTVGDACQAGVCAKGQALPCDDKNPCTLDTCSPKSGCAAVAIVGPCDADGDACTVGDQCDAKLCVPGLKKNCNDGDACTTDACDAKTGQCASTPIVGCGGNCAGDKDCDDTNPCTQDTCAGGKCAAKPAAGTCDDGSACTTGDACDQGKCTGKGLDCDDANPCTTDACDAKAGCTHAANTAACDDGDACTSGDTCTGGKCGAGKAKICDDGDDCTKDTCNPGDGQCKFNGIPGCGIYCEKASDCDDKNVCTTESCQGGKCVSGPTTLPCDDGDPCTLSDVCASGKCQSGAAKNCGDNNACTTDSCDGQSGACVNLGLAPTATCDDGNACTTGDACGGTLPSGKPSCVGKAKDCDDGNACTSDLCNPSNAGCVHTNNTAACEDGDPCSVGDTCASGTCVAGDKVWLDTLAGTVLGFGDGAANQAKFQYPYGVAVDGQGNVFVADAHNHRIRKIAPDGTVSTLAGGGQPGFQDGKGAGALFNFPYGVATDAAGNVYVADTNNHAIRKVTPGGVVTSVAGAGLGGWVDGQGSQARFNVPHGLVVGPGGALYVGDTGNHRIRVVDPSTGTVTTLAGSTPGFQEGTGAQARFQNPIGLAAAADGTLYVADQSNHRIRKVTPVGVVSTFAGSGVQGFLDGNVGVARFSNPWGVAVAPGGALLVADRYNHRIRRISGGNVATWAGNGQAGLTEGVATAGRLYYPAHLAVDASGYVLVGDGHNQRVRRIRDATSPCQIGGKCFVAGAINPSNGCQACEPATAKAQWTTLADAAACSDGDACTTADACSAGTCQGTATSCDDGDDCTQDACSAQTGLCASKPIVGCGGNCAKATDCDDKNPCTDDACTGGKCQNPANTLACDDGNACTLGDVCSGGKCLAGTAILVSTLAGGTQGNADGKGATAKFNRPAGVEVDGSGNVYVTDYMNHNIRKIAPDGTVTTLAGAGTAGYADGKGTQALFSYPSDIDVGPDGKLYVADTGNHRIRVIDKDGVVTTLAGGPAGYVDGGVNTARFNNPYAVEVTAGGVVYVADYSNHRIRKVSGGQVTTLAGSTPGYADGTGNQAKLNGPLGLSIDASGALIIADQLNHRIRKVTPAGKVTTLAGTGTAGYLDGAANQALFNQPWGVAVDGTGTVYVVDRSNQRVRKISPGGVVSKLAGTGVYGFQDGTAGVARFASPIGVAVDGQGVVYVGDYDSTRVRKIVDGSKPCLIGSTCFATGTTNPANACEICDAAKNAAAWSPKGEDAACGDGDLCTGADLCKSGNCTGPALDCNDGNDCTTDSCDSGTGACKHDPILGCNGYCDQNSQCDDKNGCTTDTCTQNKCAFVANTAACDDGNPCTVGDVCSGGKCQVGANTTVTTWAGSGVGAYADATGTSAAFQFPLGVEIMPDGSAYVADTSNHRIRKIAADGTVTTLAGSGKVGFLDATGTAAWFNGPADVARDGQGNLYVADRDNHAIRKITADGVVTSLAGGGAPGWIDASGVQARFHTPYSLAVTPAGVVYVADYGNHRIRKVLPNGKVTTLAGGAAGFKDGKGNQAQFQYPIGLGLDRQGNLFVGDYVNHRIRKVTPDGVVTTVAGSGVAGLLDGDGAVARFQYPWGIEVDSAGTVYVADRYNHRIRKIVIGTSTVVSTLAGTTAGWQDGSAATARLHYPDNLAMDAKGTLYVADGNNHRIRRVRDTALSCSIGGVCWSSGLDNPAAPCQRCDGAKSASQWTAKGDAAPCDDGDFCSSTDTCSAGTCAGASACDDNDACTADSCEAATGACTHTAIANCP